MAQDDEFWMARALALAENAAGEGEVPVGAVVVRTSALPELVFS